MEKREQIRRCLELVVDRMKNLRNEIVIEKYPIGLIDIDLWEWPQGVGLYGLYQYYQATGDEKTLGFLIDWFEDRIREGLPERNVNTTSPLLTLIALAELTGREDFDAVCRDWGRWIMNGLIRTGDNAFQHMITGDPNDGQILIDTLFMTVLFLAKAGVRYRKPAYIEEAKRQFLVHIKYLFEKKTGLFYHGWNSKERHNYGAVYWGMGNGWFTSGVIDFLDAVTVEHGLKTYLLDTLNSQVETLSRLQSPEGMWHTILDDPSSYVESSATAAFGYGILKAIRLGYLDRKYAAASWKAVDAIMRNIAADGTVGNVSYGTPVGNDSQLYKDIEVRPMTYGQALAILLLVEAAKHYEEPDAAAARRRDNVRQIIA